MSNLTCIDNVESVNDVLNDFKRNVKQSDFLPVVANEDLMLFVLGWEKIRKDWCPPDFFDEIPINIYDRWDWLWEFCSFDYNDLSLLLGKTDVMVQKLLYQAKQFHLIFPDGSIATGLSDVVAAFLLEKVEKS